MTAQTASSIAVSRKGAKGAALLLFLPIAALPAFRGAVPLWYLSLCLFLFAVPFAVWFWRKGESEFVRLYRPDLDGWMLLFFGFFALSCLFSKIPYLSLVEAFKLTAFFLVFAATVLFCGAGGRSSQRLCSLLVYTGGVLSVIGIIQYLGGLPHGWWSKPRFLSATYVNHNHFAGLLEILLPLNLALILAETDRAKQTALAFNAVLLAVAFFFTLSRGALVALSAALAVMVFLLGRSGVLRKGWWAGAIVTVVVVGALFIFGIEPIVERLASLKAIALAEQEFDRPIIWEGAFSIISRFPWFGTGPGTFEFVFVMMKPDGFVFRSAHAHNDYLELLADCGVFAFVAACAFFAILFWKGLRKTADGADRSGAVLASGCVAVLTAYFVHAIADFNFHIPANYLLFGVTCGVLISAACPAARWTDRWIVYRRGAVMAAAAAVVAGAIFFGFSDYLSWKGVRLADQGNARAAIWYLDRAVALNPVDPKIRYARGSASEEIAARLPADSALLRKKAAGDFAAAARIVPFEPYYRYHYAKNLARLVKPADLPRVLPAYRAALEAHPKDSKLHFMVARELYALNGVRRDPQVEAEAARSLVRALRLEPEFFLQAFSILWNYEPNINMADNFFREGRVSDERFLQAIERNNLWHYHRHYLLRSMHLKPLDRICGERAPIREVHWTALDFESKGEKAMNGNKFYRSGEVVRKETFSGRAASLTIKAKSTKLGGVHGYLLIRLDGSVRESVYVDSLKDKNYTVWFETVPGEHEIGIEFANDWVDRRRNEDRNVWIRSMILQEYGDR